MRLVVPYLLVVQLITSTVLARGSAGYAIFAAFQILVWLLALSAQRLRIPILHRLASPTNALLVLNAAAVVGLYTFLFTRGPLWKIWNSTKASDIGPSSEAETATPQ
jgi:hypothetical protein